MTGQIPDTVHLDGTSYAITAVDGEGLFTPEDHGLRLRPLSTACWRGFVCFYAVRDGQLLLETLEVGLGPDHPHVTLDGRRPEKASRRRGHHQTATLYRELAIPVAYRGRLLLGAERDLYTHMGFQPAWYFRRVVELVVEDGRVSNATDRSAELAEVRRRLREEPRRPRSSNAPADWITRTFSLDYSYSWPDT
jgi:hypothetical protein